MTPGNNFRDIEAWKAGHELALEIYRVTKRMEDRDPGMTERLRYAAVRAVGRIAFGSGSQNRKMFINAVVHAHCYLSEIADLLNLVRVLELLPDDECSRVESLRGRTAFYTHKLIESLMMPPTN